MKNLSYILLLFSLTVKSQVFDDFTAETHRVMVEKNEGFSIGNACGEMLTSAIHYGDLDMNFNPLELMSHHYVVTGNIVNEGELIYSCDVSFLEVRGETLTVPDPPKKEALKIYPNPVISEINIKGVQVDELELYDMTGRRLKHYKTFGQLHKIMIDDLEAGVYVLVINGHLSHKIVKI